MKLLKQSLSLFVLLLMLWAIPALAEDRSFYSPVIYIYTQVRSSSQPSHGVSD